MWCVVMFDLPVKKKQERTAATKFREHLYDLGFSRAQFSVYVQYLPLGARLTSIVKQIKTKLPNGGDVRIICVSDHQWSKAIRFSNTETASSEEPPSQLTIF